MRTGWLAVIVMSMVVTLGPAGYADIFEAAHQGDLAEVKRYLDAGVDPELHGDDEFGALHYAAIGGHPEVVKLLLDRGADVTHYAIGTTALHLAAKKGHAEVVELLLARGTDVDVTHAWGADTSLHGAAEAGHTGMVLLLLENGASLETRDQYGRTAFVVAVSEGPYQLIHRAAAGHSELFDHAADPRQQRDTGGEQPEVLARLRALAEDYLRSSPAAWGAAPDVELSEDQIQQLRALGYGVE